MKTRFAGGLLPCLLPDDHDRVSQACDLVVACHAGPGCRRKGLDFLRLRALQQAATPHELEDAEDTAAVLDWRTRDTAGQTTFVSADEARRRLDLPR
jgi:hypothetical protein